MSGYLMLPDPGAVRRRPLPGWRKLTLRKINLTELATHAIGSCCSSKGLMVEVMTRYSNNLTLLDDLRHAREVALSRDQDDEPSDSQWSATAPRGPPGPSSLDAGQALLSGAQRRVASPRAARCDEASGAQGEHLLDTPSRHGSEG